MLRAIRHLLSPSSPFSFSSTRCLHRVCVVGGGPAGFYVTQGILKSVKGPVKVDVLEKLPFPFGLVRFGVAPDHPEVKNVTNTFTNTLNRPEVEFFGNVEVGKNVSLEDLRRNYDAVVLSHGCKRVRRLGIPGEGLPNVVSAKDFVGWYNGEPDDRNMVVDLTKTDTAVIVGIGNVALDVARILLTPVDILAKTDITEYALEALKNSSIKRVHIVGRRGPLQAAFTIKELRELIKLPATKPGIRSGDVEPLAGLIKDLPRPKKRILQLMVDTARKGGAGAGDGFDTEWFLRFFLSPKAFIGSNSLESVEFTVNAAVEGSSKDQSGQKVVQTDEMEKIDAGLAFVSIGYLAEPIEPSLPFNKRKGIYVNVGGRVEGTPGVYCCGWTQSGAVGVILSTMSNAFAIADVIANDLNSGTLDSSTEKLGSDVLKELLQVSGVQVVTKQDWTKLDAIEEERGKKRGKKRGSPREKITCVEEALSLLR